jgi:hypothetical protein
VTNEAGKFKLQVNAKGDCLFWGKPQCQDVKLAYDRLPRPRNTVGNARVHGTCGYYRAPIGEDLAYA